MQAAKLVTIVGARPQFIKVAAVSRALAARARAGGVPVLDDCLVHTGQHYDANMSQVFFDELRIPAPRHHLGIGSAAHGEQTGRMLQAIERVLLEEKPACVLVYGDTNSTLAGALAARKLNLRVAHVEAGLRSFNMRMPEEVNRILADRISDWLFCPTPTAVANLHHEGITRGVENVGDVMYDASLFSREQARSTSRIMETLGVTPGQFVLATVHRAENTDDPARLAGIVAALARVAETSAVILALHPRTRRFLREQKLGGALGRVRVIDPVPYFDMIRLEESARAICTDSGGVQKEAFFYGVPCVTLRDETEWVETVAAGWNQLTGAHPERIVAAVAAGKPAGGPPAGGLYGDGRAADKILDRLCAEMDAA
jgi:UDP-GlcNAc3NAcA epimerase